jgi:protein-S-isoprenylcysteine O-methyltransferase Ste14
VPHAFFEENTPSQTLLSATVLLSAYLTYRSITSPNPPPAKPYAGDRISSFFGPVALLLRRINVLFLQLALVFVALTFSNPPRQTCPHPSNLNPILFTWTTYTTTCVLDNLRGCSTAACCVSRLGSEFHVSTDSPGSAYNGGIYKYMQHPNYTGQAIVLAANLALFVRWDGALGSWIPPDKLEGLRGWCSTVFVVLAAMSVLGIGTRVRDEERMLKVKFGKDWEEWHRRTKRFIPGVF